MKRRILSIVLSLCLGLSVSATAAGATFTDVPDEHWAYEFVEKAVNEGWISGNGDGKFGVNDQITYAQAATMFVQAFFQEDLTDYDGPTTPWYLPFTQTADFICITASTDVDGSYDDDFKVNQPVNRYEMAQMINNTLQQKALWFLDLEFDTSSVADWNKIPVEYQSSVEVVNATGIISGIDSNGTFNGDGMVTRGQAAVIMTRLNEVIENGGVITPAKQGQPKEVEQSQESDEDFINEVLRLVNEERAEEGLSPMTTNDTINEAAKIRAGELEELFDHTRPDGSSCFSALNEMGISYWTAGENIAFGASSPESVMDMWMNSEGHRANILNESFDTIGVGRVENYWVQMFIGS